MDTKYRYRIVNKETGIAVSLHATHTAAEERLALYDDIDRRDGMPAGRYAIRKLNKNQKPQHHGIRHLL